MDRSRNSLTRRMVPLYIAVFMQGFVFWYAVEKVFMASIGFSGVTFGLLAATYAAMSLFLEIPSGILADRWSRKGILMIAGVMLAVSSLVCGLTSSVAVYIFGGAVLWGAFNALESGTSESIVYDLLKEEVGSSKDFTHFYGRVQVVMAASLVVSALFGGLIGDVLSLRATYLLTVPIALGSLIPLLLFREPTLHKRGVSSPLKDHAWLTIRSVTHQRKLVPVLIVLVTGALVTSLVLEFSQLWLLALSVSVAWYGVAGAVLYGTYGVGGATAERIAGASFKKLGVIVGVMIVSALGLMIVGNAAIIILLQCLVLIIVTAVKVVYTQYLHDELPSKVRAGSASAVSTLAGLLFIPTALLFGVITDRSSVFTAAGIVLALVVLMAFAIGWHSRSIRKVSV